MYNAIKIKRSSVAGKIPSNLVEGELAINIKDKRMFFLDSMGVLQSFDLVNTSTSAIQDPASLIYKSAIETNNQTNLLNLINQTWL